MDDLPTPHNLYKRNYTQSPNCHQCNQISTSLHWTICPSSHLLNNLIDNSLKHVLNTSTLDTSLRIVYDLHNQIKNLNCMQNYNIPNSPSLTTTLSGLISYELIDSIKDITLSTKTATTLSIKFLLHLNQQIYTQIWIPYCTSRPQPSRQSQPTSTSHTSQNLLTQHRLHSIASPKIETWYPKWIKYQMNPLIIITNSEI